MEFVASSEFTLSSDVIYFNSANLSVLPDSVLEAVDIYARKFNLNPSLGLECNSDDLWGAQLRLASFLHASPYDIFLRSNVTSVLNSTLLGLPLSLDDEILIGEFEYGAIANICRLRAERDGLPLRVLKLPASIPAFERLTQEALLDFVFDQLGPQTRLLLLSHVIGVLGIVVPIEAVASECRRRGIFLVVDGAYAPGAFDFSFSSIPSVDFYGCSLYKWLLGPKGTAFGFVSPRCQELLRPLEAGWTTFEPAGPLKNFAGGNPFQLRWVMKGCHDFSPFRALVDLFDFWERLGVQAIFERRRSLQTYLEARLPWRQLVPRDVRLRGPLSTFLLPDSLQRCGDRFARAAFEVGIQLSAAQVRGLWYAVLSPHIYNTEAEIDEVVVRLQHLAGLSVIS